MKLTTLICMGLILLYAVFAAVYALTGVNAIALLCAGSEEALRAVHAAVAVSAGWLAFWMIAFRPFAALS